MKFIFNIQRFDPEKDKAPYFKEYEVELEPTDRVLDGLHEVKWKHDGTLALRRSCAHGICGSDAMRINGKNSLACKVLVKDAGHKITVQPMMGFKVVKDLVVDMKEFFSKYKSVQPFLMNNDPAPEKERLQDPKDREKFDDTTKCILCGACTTSCPSFWTNHEYVGPAAIVAAHRFLFDSRDQAKKERLKILDTKDGVWRCRTVFNCVEACPRDINVTRAIGEVKKTILENKS